MDMELWLILVVLDENGFVYMAGNVDRLKKERQFVRVVFRLTIQ